METDALKPIIEAAVMAAEGAVTLERLASVFAHLNAEAPSHAELLTTITALQSDYVGRGIELVEVAGGYRFQTRATYAQWVNRLWEERKPRYSRALLETLAIIAYRQPITRGEIEDIRGVAVSTGIIKTLHDREWVKIVGHRDVPGRPAIYATTRQFLEYFNLTSLDALPTLAELKDFDDFNPDLFADVMTAEAESSTAEDHRGDLLLEEPRGDEEPMVDSESAATADDAS
ncbi:MAG: SMC-Scp complex subunit ScpB [Gammaproteobacteria bacterium]|nr:SMC-Scp complex subunit ScpB [Gammaproteobacteria bacterium]